MIGAFVAIVVLGIAVALNQRGEDVAADSAFFTVKRGPLTISITESGAIKPREEMVLKSEVQGQASILFIKPEGEHVKKGDLLVELDSGDLEDRRVDQDIRVQNADAAFINAREGLAVSKNQSKSDVERAELDFTFAKQDRERYRLGEHPRALKAAESQIILWTEEVTRAQEKLKWSKVLYDEKYLSLTELQSDQLSEKQAKLELELKETDLKLLKEYSQPRDMAELESDVYQNEMALERAKRKASADILQSEANLRAKDSELQRQKSKLEKLEEQIVKAKIYAPMDGLVIYSTSSGGGWRGNQEPLAEGQMVRERQELIRLPTTASYVAEINVHESSLNKIQPGMPVRITVEALEGRTYTGSIESIAPLPDAQSMWMNPDLKVFDTKILIDSSDEALRNGMTCKAELILAQYEDAVYVPVQAILRILGEPTVFVDEGGEWVPRTVELGLDNNRLAHIVSGLAAGEKVLLTPPLEAAIVEADGSEDIIEPKSDSSGETSGTSKKPDTPVSEKAKGAEAKNPALTNPQGEGASVAPIEPPAEKKQPAQGFAPSNMSAEQRDAMRKRIENMTDEERQAMRRRFENMSPEDMKAMRERYSQGRGAAGSGGGSGRP